MVPQDTTSHFTLVCPPPLPPSTNAAEPMEEAIDPEFLAALPPELQAEVMEQQVGGCRAGKMASSATVAQCREVGAGCPRERMLVSAAAAASFDLAHCFVLSPSAAPRAAAA